LREARNRDYVGQVEKLDRNESYYNMYEAMMTGRDMHTYDRNKPSDSYRDLCNIEHIKAASVAHAVNKLMAKIGRNEKVLVICAAHHMAFGYGMPQRIWK
jgi:hypothetical protein